MSNPENQTARHETDPPQNPLAEQPSTGPNLTVIYSLIALAMAAAIGFAVMIVLPFYHRR